MKPLYLLILIVLVAGCTEYQQQEQWPGCMTDIFNINETNEYSNGTIVAIYPPQAKVVLENGTIIASELNVCVDDVSCELGSDVEVRTKKYIRHITCPPDGHYESHYRAYTKVEIIGVMLRGAGT